jgi:exopolysaccharide production protein ExoY
VKLKDPNVQESSGPELELISASNIYSMTHSEHGLTARLDRTQVKRCFDLMFSAVGLLAVAPFILFVAMILCVLEGRPVFIKHLRVGRGGSRFGCLKFRTMVVDADAVLQRHLADNEEARTEWQATHKLRDDPRVTRLGQVLRRTSVDELPQLLNVLRGDMSIVGPRPVVESELHYYGAQLGHYLTVRPGLTGAWQVGGRSDTSYSSRVQMDVDYVANWSLGRDLTIIFKTIPAVLSAKGSR